MKYWKFSLLTVFALATAVILVVHTSCERNVCDNVTCYNGGSCNGSGTCTCPVGYTGPQCSIVVSSYFIGNYAGTLQCDDESEHGGYEADSVQITASSNVDFVNVAFKGEYDTSVIYLTGYMSINEATYSIIVAADSTSNYIQRYTITLQGNSLLTINTYQWDARDVKDTFVTNCYLKANKL